MVRATDFFSEEDYWEARDALDREYSGDHWSNHFATFADACHYYGCDTPEQLAAEDAYYWARNCEESCDAIEARGGPDYCFSGYGIDDIPF